MIRIGKVLFFTFLLLSVNAISQAPDCVDSQLGCDAVTNGFPISPSGYGLIEESNFGANNVSWPPSNPQGVNSGCMFANELNSTWISFTILNDGTLEFTLGVASSGGYYDWILWENSNGLACEEILNDQLPPVSCNWNASSQGFTGMADPGGLPPGAVSGNFQPPLNVQAGDQFILCFSNYSGLSGVTVPFNNYGIDTGDPNAADFICSSPTTISNATICAGDTTNLEIMNPPGNITSYSWSPATDISNPFGGPIVSVWPGDTTVYTCTMVSPDSTWTNDVTVFVHTAAIPYAGLDDTICFSDPNGYPLNGVLGNPASPTFNWEMASGPPVSPPPNAAFVPGATTLATNVIVTELGLYEFVLIEEDIEGICPAQTDTVSLLFSEETHTTVTTDPACFGNSDGTIVITSTGAIGANQFSINGGGTWFPTNTFTGLASGTYYVMSQDAYGCDFLSTATLTDPLEVMITTSNDTTICQNGTATLSALATNGSNFDYHWTHTSSLNSSQPATPSPAGTDMSIDVYALSDLGCSSDTNTIQITHHDPITLAITSNDTVCPGYDATMIVTPIGGYLGYTYSWTANGLGMTDTLTTININPDQMTTYCATVADGCETTPEQICSEVHMRPVPNPTFMTDTTAGCIPTYIQFDNTTGSITDSLTWQIGGSYFYNDPSVSIVFDQPGTYDVWLEVYSAYGCFAEITAPEYITIYDSPVAFFYATPNPATIFEPLVEFVNISEGENLTYTWSFAGGSPAGSSVENPEILYPEGVVGQYPVQLIVVDENNCVDSVSSIVDVNSDIMLYAPNVFTPDGDSYNETWRVYIDGIEFDDFHLTMFNRYGEIIWESYDAEGVWDGTYGSQGLVQDGTYIWVINCNDAFNDKRYDFRGHVTVLK